MKMNNGLEYVAKRDNAGNNEIGALACVPATPLWDRGKEGPYSLEFQPRLFLAVQTYAMTTSEAFSAHAICTEVATFYDLKPPMFV